MGTIEILHDYGWAGVLVIMLADRLFPFFAGKLFPHLQKQQAAKIDAEKEEREFRHTMELRQANAFDELVKTTQSIQRFMVSVDDRLGGIEHELRGQANARPRKPKRKPARS